MNDSHLAYMQLALEQARRAGEDAEVPVGAVLVSDGGALIAAERNRTLRRRTPPPMPSFWCCARVPAVWAITDC